MMVILSNETTCNDIQDAEPMKYIATDSYALQGDYDLDDLASRRLS